MTKTIYAIIPARQGSKGVVNKNIKLLGGHPLIAYSIALAKLTPEVSRVIVSTDSSEYGEIARAYGAEVPFLRPLELANDNSTDLEFFNHSIDWFLENEKKIPDYFLHLRPTTPLREPSIVSAGINFFLNSSINMTSLRSGHICSESPFKWFRKNNLGYFTTLTEDQNLEYSNKARQEYPLVYIPDGYIDIVKSAFIKEEKKLHGNYVAAFESPFCIEIDSEDEFDLLEYFIMKKGSILKKYLDEMKNDKKY
jgi:N-acylneuraminate cytidylyltransferase